MTQPPVKLSSKFLLFIPVAFYFHFREQCCIRSIYFFPSVFPDALHPVSLQAIRLIMLFVSHLERSRVIFRNLQVFKFCLGIKMWRSLVRLNSSELSFNSERAISRKFTKKYFPFSFPVPFCLSAFWLFPFPLSPL